MKIISTIKILFLLVAITAALSANAQWCSVDAVPYMNSMPGITNVTLNTINRTSEDLENMSNSYIITGESTTLQKGSTYNISITHTVDEMICPDMNLRVWIDYNQDFTFDPATETALTIDHHLPGTYTSAITIPATASTGVTRMRVTAKMSDLGGHTAPTPCNIPADPLGYHGEVEDYDVNITTATGLEDFNIANELTVYPNPSNDLVEIKYQLATTSDVNISIYNMLGEKVKTLMTEANQNSGEHVLAASLNSLPDGMYFVNLHTTESSRIRLITKSTAK